MTNTNNSYKRLIALVLAFILAFTSLNLGTSYFAEAAETAPITVSLEWEDSEFKNGTQFDLVEDSDLSNVVKLIVTYKSNNVGEHGYMPGELVITVKGIGKVKRNGVFEAVVGADKAEEGTKNRDWTYTWNRGNDTYTFVNNNEIKANSFISGFFELVWEVDARKSKHNYSQKDVQANILFHDGTYALSQPLSFTNSTTEDTFALQISAESMKSYEGLTNDFGDKKPDDYRFVRYNVTATNTEHSRGIESFYFLFDPDENAANASVADQVIVISPERNCEKQEDGKYKVGFDIHSTSDPSPAQDQFIFVAYPKEPYEDKTAKAVIGLHGKYYEGNNIVVELASDSVSSPINSSFDFPDQSEGNIYSFSKGTAYGQSGSGDGDILGTRMVNGTTETFYLKASLNNFNREQKTLLFVDDFLYISKNNGKYRQLESGEYEFTQIEIPGTKNLKNSNGISIADGEYYVEIYAWKDGEEVDFTDKGCDRRTTIQESNMTIGLPAKTTSIAIKFINIEESFYDMKIPVSVSFKTNDTSNKEWDEQDNLKTGQVVNTAFLKLYDGSGTWINKYTEDNYSNESNLNLAQKDYQTHGAYLDREKAEINFYAGEKQNYSAITTLGTLEESGNKIYIDFTMGANLYFRQDEYPDKFSLYTILPKDFQLDKYKVPEDIWDIMQLKTNASKLDEAKLVAACTPMVITNYQGSGRTYIGLTFEFDEEDAKNLQYGKQISATFKLKADKSYRKGHDNVYATSCVLIDKKIDEVSDGKVKDNGEWGENPTLFVDIDGDGYSDETLACNSDTENDIYADSGEMQISKYVKTTYSDGWAQPDDVALQLYGGQYQYKLELTNGSNTATNIVIKDILESEIGSAWQGTLQSVDLTQCEALGLSGTVYYSTVSSPGDKLSDSSVWSTVMPGSGIKAVAVDFGTCKLKAGKTLSIVINMLAPYYLAGNTAKNAASASFTLVDAETGNGTDYPNQKSPSVTVKLSEKLRTMIVKTYDSTDGSGIGGATIQLLKSVFPDEIITEQVTNSKGYAVFHELSNRSFNIHGAKPPIGYDMLNPYNYYEFSSNDDVGYCELPLVRKEGTVELVSVNNLDKSITVPGATYALYDSDGNPVGDEMITGAQGKITFPPLPWGSYTIKEISPPAGYVRNETVYSVEVDRYSVMDTIRVEAVEIQKDATVHMIKYAAKVDGTSTGETLSGAIFELIRENSDIDEKRMGLYVTDVNGKIDITGLPYGNYFFREYRAPAGYELAENVGFILSPSESEVSRTVKDRHKPGKITLVKSDTLGNKISDAEFTLYDENKNPIKEYTTDANGLIVIENLEWGTYYIGETYLPDCYLPDLAYSVSAKKELLVDKDNLDILLFSESDTVKGSVLLTKTDETGSHKLAGAEYNLYTNSGELISSYTTDAKGEIKLVGLEWGSYYLKETKAPNGFGLSDETVRFSVNKLTANKMQYLNVTDPQTGKTITLTKTIKASEINFENGDPTFMFKVTGIGDIDKQEHTYYRMVTFTESYVRDHTDINGNVSSQVTVSGIPAGVYTVSEEDTSRYVLSEIKNLENGVIIEGNKVELDVLNNETAAAEFISEKYEYQYFSDNRSVTNIIKSRAKLTAIRADYKDTDVMEGSELDLGKLTVTALYDDGSNKELKNGEYTIVGNVNAFPFGASAFTVTITYTEDDITRTDSFNVTVQSANTNQIVRLEATLNGIDDKIEQDVPITPDMFKVKATYGDKNSEYLSSDKYIVDPETSPKKTGGFNVTISLNPEIDNGEYAKNGGYTVKTKVTMTVISTPKLMSGWEFNALIPEEVEKVVFTDESKPSSVDWNKDVSAANDGSVVAWIEPGSTTMKVSTQLTGVKVIANPDCSGMFAHKYNLKNVTFSDDKGVVHLDTSRVTNMSSMFSNCANGSGFEVKGLGQLDVSNVTDMSYLFEYIGSWGRGDIIIGDLSGWDVSNVTNMSSMFDNCGFNNSGKIDIIGLDGWDVYNVTNMYAMFQASAEFKNILDLSGWVVKQVDVLEYACFENCLDKITPPKDWVNPYG